MTQILEIQLSYENKQEPKQLLLNSLDSMETGISNRSERNPQGHWSRVKIGDVVLVHDDTPRIKWRLAVIEVG